MQKIDLSLYTSGGKVRNLSGKDRGLAARKEFGMDELDQSDDQVVVRIPEYVYAISTSFFCGMFSRSYNVLGPDGFRQKYVFKAHQDLGRQIDQGLERCSYEFEPLMTVVR